MTRNFVTAGLLGAVFAGAMAVAGMPALAAGSSSNSSSDTGGSPAASVSPNGQLFADAQAKIAAADYQGAIPLLMQVVLSDPNNADALNLLGYSNRKLGRFDSALGYYQQALSLEPDHLGANEYLGELYLEMGNVAAAEERLGVLNDACFLGCEEFDELQEAIETYRAANPGT